jgi:hypothetical protein
MTSLELLYEIKAEYAWSVEGITTLQYQSRPHFTILTLGSFIISFAVARTFTFFNPDVVLVSGGIHIHHFWFGMLLLAIGGWLGINYNKKEVDMVAAIVYGVGGGLIADELGLLLTLGDYYSGLTWTSLLLLLASVAILALLRKYRQSIYTELHEFIGSKSSLYIGILLTAISFAFVIETSNFLITLLFALMTVIGVLIVLAFAVHKLRQSLAKKAVLPNSI